MPYKVTSYERLPFAGKRYTPDTSRLGSIYARTGAQLAELALQRGRTMAEGLAGLGSIYSGTLEGIRGDRARADAVKLRAAERADEKAEREAVRKAEREERAETRRIEREGQDRAAARWMVDNMQPGPVSGAAAQFAERFPETAARFSPQMTLPARVAPGAMGSVDPTPRPTGQMVLAKSADDARADQALAAQGARWAAEDARASRDDARADKALEATIANQQGMLRVAQQNAASTALNARTNQSRYTASGVDTAKMPTEIATALERAVMSLPAAKRKQQVEFANRLAEANNLPELKSVIVQAAIEGENVDAKNQIRGRMATIAALEDAKTVLADLKRAGVPTNILTGSLEDISRRLGTTTDPALVRLKTQLADAVVNYRRAATGVAFSEKESAEYERMFPNYKQTEAVNLATIDGLLKAMQTNNLAYWRGKVGDEGVRVLFGQQAQGGAPPDDPAGLFKK